MQKYIGTKLIEAEPCPSWKVFNDRQQGEPGYRVRYADGYESWSPKEIFEATYLPLNVNPNLRTAAPSISEEMVNDFIASTEVTTMGGKCTVVRAVLRNGFEIVEASACVSEENYDEALGAKICIGKIRDKVWMLLGFLLQTAVNGV